MVTTIVGETIYTLRLSKMEPSASPKLKTFSVEPQLHGLEFNLVHVLERISMFGRNTFILGQERQTPMIFAPGI